jgi:hypothetical protein
MAAEAPGRHPVVWRLVVPPLPAVRLPVAVAQDRVAPAMLAVVRLQAVSAAPPVE